MPTTITPTALTYSQPIAPALPATGTNGTVTTLDLTTKRGAWLYGFIGRQVVTALTRSGYILVRPTKNNTTVVPATRLDMVSTIAVASAATTVSSGGASGTNTVTVTSATGFAVGDVIALWATGPARVEFARIASISGSVLTVEENFRTSHSAGDNVVSGADVFFTWIPGGDVYSLGYVNNSGQGLVFQLDAAVDNGDTST